MPPVQELPDELVELRGAQNAGGQRAGQVGLFVRLLGRDESGGGLVRADDGHGDDPVDSRLSADLVQVAGGGAEELRGGLLVGGVP